MKSCYKVKKLPLLVVMVLSVLLLAVSAFAAEKVSINYHYATDNVEFKLYKVGSISNEGEIVLSDRYAAYSVNLEDTSAAQTLAAYVERDSVAYDLAVKTDSDGNAVFSDLDRGVYLISGGAVTKNKVKYSALPVLTAIYGNESKAVDISGKFETENVSGGSHSGSSTSDKNTTSTSSTSSGGSSTTNSSGGGRHSSSVNPKEITVLKVWEGGKSESEITAQLLKNGEVYDEVVLNDDNNWRYTWKNVSRTDTWTVVEKAVPSGYQVSMEKSGTTFVLTNSPKPISSETPGVTENSITPQNPGEPLLPGTTDTSSSSSSSNTDSSTANPEQPGLNTGGGSDDTSVATDDVVKDISQESVDSVGAKQIDESSDSTPNDKTPKESSVLGKLPQTGQLWWPVTILSGLGILFIIIGIGRKRAGR
jgi:hypothetical protein